MVIHLGARQEVGKSFTMALATLPLAGGYRDAETRVPAADVHIASKDGETAKNLIRECDRHIQSCERNTGVGLTHPKLGSLSRIALESGRYVSAYSSKPDGVQGMTGHAMIDEWSKGDTNPEELLAQALSITASNAGYRLSIATNADFDGSFIHHFLQSDESEWVARRANAHIITTTIDDIYPTGYPAHIEAIKATMHPDMWARFFLCRFLGSDNPAFAPELITGAGLKLRTLGDAVARVLCVDIGMTDNPTGYCVLALTRGRVDVLESGHWYRCAPDTQRARIRDLVTRYRCARLYVDAGAVGWQLGNELATIYGDRCIRVSVSQANRDRWHGAAHDLLARGAVAMPGATELQRDLRTMRLAEGARLVVPEYRASNGHNVHCDAGEAFLYAMDDPALTRAPSVVVQADDPLRGGFRF